MNKPLQQVIQERIDAAYYELLSRMETATVLTEAESEPADWDGNKYPTYGSVVGKSGN